MNNHFSPDVKYKFPRSSTSGRSFQHHWLVRYPWLKYSKQDDGGYCLPCVMFYTSKNFHAQAGVLVSYALTNFKHAIDSLKKHERKDYHKEAVVKMDAFVKVMSGHHDSISLQINNAAKECVAKNRKKQSIIETTILCGRQNISLRGHRDHGTLGACVTVGAMETFGLSFNSVSSGDTYWKSILILLPWMPLTLPDIQNRWFKSLSTFSQTSH